MSTPTDDLSNESPILDRLSLAGRTAIVTGAGAGIGRALAHALGEAGARVGVVDLDPVSAKRVAAELSKKGARAAAYAVDVREQSQVRRMVDSVARRWGTGVTIAVNNAGIIRNSPAEETPFEEWDAVMSVNLRAVMLCCQAEARLMLSQGYGKIINVASIASLVVPSPQRQAAYNASKSAVVGLTRSLAVEWAGRGVRVNALSPGIIRTGLIATDALSFLASADRQVPAGRIGDVTDLQGAAVYLASGASDYMTGAHVVIDGGLSLL